MAAVNWMLQFKLELYPPLDVAACQALLLGGISLGLTLRSLQRRKIPAMAPPQIKLLTNIRRFWIMAGASVGIRLIIGCASTGKIICPALCGPSRPSPKIRKTKTIAVACTAGRIQLSLKNCLNLEWLEIMSLVYLSDPIIRHRPSSNRKNQWLYGRDRYGLPERSQVIVLPNVMDQPTASGKRR